MREVLIRRRADGVTEVTPRLAPLELADRWVIIFTVAMAAFAFFNTGVMPAEILATVIAACLAGELVLGAKALVLLVLRPPAEVHEVARFRRR
jgi:hypothetical protein